MPTVNDESPGVFYVRPRYLAGSTWTGDPALQPFYDQGWSLHYDARGNLHVAAPDQRVRISYLPEGDDDTLWKVAVHREPPAPPRWVAEFNDATPTEIGLTTALAEDYRSGTERFLDGSTNPDHGYEPLAAARWNRMDLGLYDRYRVFMAPDGLAYLTLYDRYLHPLTEPVGEQERWTFCGWPAGWGSRWYGTFSSRTPATWSPPPQRRWPTPPPSSAKREKSPSSAGTWSSSPPSSHRSPRCRPRSTCAVPPSPRPSNAPPRTRHANPRALAAHARTTSPLPPNGARPAATPSDQRPSPAATPRPGLRP